MNILELTKDIASSKAHEVRENLHNEFQREIFDAAATNLIDHTNKLRINNFAYAARELIRIYLSSVLDDGDVVKCFWFKGDGKGKPTRAERMHYAIHRGLDPEIVRKRLGYDPNVIIKSLLKNIDSLSKYTHISDKTFPTDECDNELALNLFENLAEFLGNITDAEKNIISALEDDVYKAAEEGLLSEYFEAVDHLATHHGIEGIYIDSVHIELFDSNNLTFVVGGQLEFSLQWGSNSDIRKGDGAIGGIDIQFSATVKADIEDITNLEVVSYNLKDEEKLMVRLQDEE